MIRRRPLRSVFLGNPRYLSVYALGVGQAMGLLGHWHRFVSVFDSAGDVARQIAEMAPDVIWTHTVLWPPPGALGLEPTQDRLLGETSALAIQQFAEILSPWKRRGAAVFLHDGDPRERPLPAGVDVPSVFSLALINRSAQDHFWRVPSVRWPYAAMVQKEIASPVSEWTCDLLFAGLLRLDVLYSARTALVYGLQERLGPRMRIVSSGQDPNNRMLVADVAPSATAVLGFGRPEVHGWIDTRVFQYPGAGGVLIHDDAGEFLWPDEHYLRFERQEAVDSVLRCLARARTEGPAIRERAFAYVQKHHTWVHRVEAALTAFFGDR